MRVLLLNHFPLHGSGTGTYTHDLAKGLTEAGHEVECLVLDSERGESTDSEPFRVSRIICRAGDAAADLPFDFPCFTTHPQSRQTFHELTDSQISLYREVLRHRLDEQVSSFDPHVIHGQHIWIQGHLALETGVPYVLTAQGTDSFGYRQDARFHPYAQQAAENASRILAPSELLRQHVLQTFDLPPDVVLSQPSAVDLDLFQRAEGNGHKLLARLGLPVNGGPIVAYVGKLAPLKGVETLFNAAAIYEASAPQPRTVIMGDGAQRGELELQARRLGLERTLFVGDRSRDECAQLYAAADLVVVPARGESYSTVALEALASGTPVVATRAGGLDEMIDDSIGGLVPVDDHELLADMVIRALAENWKQSKGPATREYVRQSHDSRQWVEQIVTIYETILHERFGRRTWQ